MGKLFYFYLKISMKKSPYLWTCLQFMVTSTGFEPVNAAVKGQCVKPLHQLAKKMVGLGGLEPPTSRLSGVRSNQLSYNPISRTKLMVSP